MPIKTMNECYSYTAIQSTDRMLVRVGIDARDFRDREGRQRGDALMARLYVQQQRLKLRRTK